MIKFNVLGRLLSLQTGQSGAPTTNAGTFYATVPRPDEEEKRTPIGVPPGGIRNPFYNQPASAYSPQGSDYTTLPGTIQTPQVTPKYFRGDELVPGYSWGPEKIIQAQNSLVTMGMLKRGSYQSGIWDDKTADAYSQLLGYANSTGKSDVEAAAEITERVTKYGDTISTNRTPFVSQTTSPKVLANMAKELASRVMDRGISDDEALMMAQSFNQLEIAAQRQFYDARGEADTPGPGGNVESPGNFGDYAETQLKEAHPEAVAGASLLHNADSFFSLLQNSRSRYNQAVQ